MPDFKHHVYLEVDGSAGVVIEALGTQEEGRVQLTVRRGLPDESGEVLGRVAWTVDFENKALRFEAAQAMATPAQAACLAGCLMGVAGPLANCLRRAKTVSDAWNCIDENVTASVLTAIGCVVGCL